MIITLPDNSEIGRYASGSTDLSRLARTLQPNHWLPSPNERAAMEKALKKNDAQALLENPVVLYALLTVAAETSEDIGNDMALFYTTKPLRLALLCCKVEVASISTFLSTLPLGRFAY